jgi:hypothetical protein
MRVEKKIMKKKHQRFITIALRSELRSLITTTTSEVDMQIEGSSIYKQEKNSRIKNELTCLRYAEW